MSALSRPRRLIFAALTALAVLLGLEVLLRLAGFHYSRSLSYMQFNFPNPNELHQIFEPDPQLLWRLRPAYDFGQGFDRLNQQGFRGPELTKAKPPGALRIACLGDSVTFGQAYASYPALLSDLLSKKLGAAIEAQNFGVPGYSSEQGLRLLPRVLNDYRPDLCIILFGWNDHWLAKGFSDRNQVSAASSASVLLETLRRLRVYQLLNRVIAGARAKVSPPPLALRVPPEDYRANLEAMIAACRAAGVRPILATAPSAVSLGQVPDFLTYLEFIRDPADLARLHRQYNDIVRAVAAETHTPLVDLDQVFESHGVRALFDHPDQDVIHPNRAGYQLLVDSLTPTLLPELKALKAPVARER